MFCQGITKYILCTDHIIGKKEGHLYSLLFLILHTFLNSKILTGGGELRPQEAGPAAGGPGALTGADQGAAGGSRGQGADRALTGADLLADTDTGLGGTSRATSQLRRRPGRARSRSGSMARASCLPASGWCSACSASTDL